MKKLISAQKDYIINYWHQCKVDKGGKILWVDEPNQISELENKVESIEMFVQIPDTATFIAVSLSPSDIKGLAGIIKQIEAEKVDPAFIDV